MTWTCFELNRHHSGPSFIQNFCQFIKFSTSHRQTSQQVLLLQICFLPPSGKFNFFITWNLFSSFRDKFILRLFCPSTNWWTRKWNSYNKVSASYLCGGKALSKKPLHDNGGKAVLDKLMKLSIIIYASERFRWWIRLKSFGERFTGNLNNFITRNFPRRFFFVFDESTRKNHYKHLVSLSLKILGKCKKNKTKNFLVYWDFPKDLLGDFPNVSWTFLQSSRSIIVIFPSEKYSKSVENFSTAKLHRGIKKFKKFITISRKSPRSIFIWIFKAFFIRTEQQSNRFKFKWIPRTYQAHEPGRGDEEEEKRDN